ncbi:MAG: NUDIX domain-containing protein [Alistipes sp.]|nr:NUDIX domain-containing protein [Alistipes sp.]
MDQADKLAAEQAGNIIVPECLTLPLPEKDDGSIEVYWADRLLLFSTDAVEGYYLLRLADGEKISRAKIIDFLRKYNYVAVVGPRPRDVFEDFAAQFVWVDAAGGVVKNSQGEVVMICRNGRWDLPKGHRESGESFSVCAAREAEEETGVKVDSVGRLLCTTLHFYNLYGRWELKHTAWYEMMAASRELTPQREEGIVLAEWVAMEDIQDRIKESYPTIKNVVASL